MNTAQERVAAIQQRYPKEGLFADKEWNIGPEPFFIEPALADEIRHNNEWKRPVLDRCLFQCRQIQHRFLPLDAQALRAFASASVRFLAQAFGLRNS